MTTADEIELLNRRLADARKEIARLRIELGTRPECVIITHENPDVPMTTRDFRFLKKRKPLDIEIRANGHVYRFVAARLTVVVP